MAGPLTFQIAGVFVPDHFVGRAVPRKEDVGQTVARQVAQRGGGAHAGYVFVDHDAIPAAIELAVAQNRKGSVVSAKDDIVPAIVVHIADQHHVIAGVRADLVPKNA